MSSFVPKGNTSLRVRGTASGSTSSYNGAPAAGGELDDTAQMGADSTDQSATAGQLGGADQISSGYGYDVSGMLPVSGGDTIANTNASPTTAAPAPPTSNKNVSADQVIGTPGPAGGQEAPARFVLFYSGEAGESLVSNVANPIALISSGAGATAGSGGNGQVVVTIDSIAGTLDVSTNVGMIIGDGETKPAPSSFGGVVAFTGSSGTLQLNPSSGFTGTVAGMSGRDTIDFSDVNFTTPQAPNYSGNSSGGALTVSDGSHTANVALIGNYLASTFVASSDGHGGTSVMQVPSQSSANDSITHPKA